MKKILFNGSSLVNKENYGIQRNTLELLKAVDKIGPKGKYGVVIPRDGERDLSFENIEVIKAGHIGIVKGDIHFWNNIVFPGVVKLHNAVSVDTLLSAPILGNDAIMICDCIREMFPENCHSFRDRLSRKWYMMRTAMAVRTSKVILTISETSKRDIMKYYHVKKGRIVVIPCGWQHMNDIAEDDGIIERLHLEKGKYVYSLGSRYYHKNTAWIKEAAKNNPSEIFVVSGSNAFDQKDIDTLPTNILYTGYVSDSEAKALMKNAMVFLQPSLYEGFGLPPMEAMSTGTRCIVAKAGALPEIYGDSVWYINPYSSEHEYIDMIMFEKTGNLNDVLDKYSWDKSGRKLVKVLAKLEARINSRDRKGRQYK